jgi:hypothetical protein
LAHNFTLAVTVPDDQYKPRSGQPQRRFLHDGKKNYRSIDWATKAVVDDLTFLVSLPRQKRSDPMIPVMDHTICALRRVPMIPDMHVAAGIVLEFIF